MKTILTVLAFSCFALSATADPYLVSPDGTYLGKLGGNKYDPESTSNPYGEYGSRYSPKSINNPYGEYGSRYSDKSPNNPYATQAPNIYGDDRW